MVKVAVLGAGINGVTCALKIKEKYKHFDVVIISKDFSPDTTGDGSGGLWYPYLSGDTPPQLLTKWGIETYKFYHEHWLKGGLDIALQPVYVMYRAEHNEDHPIWADQVFGYRNFSGKQLEYLSQLFSAKYVGGHMFTTFVVQPTKLISYFFNNFTNLGGRVVQHTVSSLDDVILEDYDIVINCTGLGSRWIVPDEKCFPIRGQILKTIAPWLNYTVLDKDCGFYMIPNAETCVLGGTSQKNNFSTEPNREDTDHILNGCRTMVPGLQRAGVAAAWAGLRPGRGSVRLEPERRGRTLYVHNYGHGGSGLTLFWGCGNHVLDILEQNIRNETQIHKSKL